MSVRSEREAEFKADWAGIPALSGWRVVATEKPLGDVREPTALIRQKSIGRAASAPNSKLDVGLLLTLIAPYTDADEAADLLDIAVPAAVEYLRKRYLAEPAEAVGWTGKRLAYDIRFNVIANRE